MTIQELLDLVNSSILFASAVVIIPGTVKAFALEWWQSTQVFNQAKSKYLSAFLHNESLNIATTALN